MKWFKHLSTARNDEKIARLEDIAGLEGYGFYFKMLELVAEIIDATGKCEVTYSITRWGRQANITTKKFLILLQRCSDVGLMSVQRVGDDVTVKIPNLLKYRDNHTRNLQVTSKQEEEEYKEEREEEGEEKDSAPASAGMAAPESRQSPRHDCPHQEIIAEYHRILPGLMVIRDWTPQRQKLLRSRWAENQERQELAWWTRYFESVRASPFLMGQNEKGWQADLEWLIRPSNMPKVIEGKYMDRGGGNIKPLSSAGVKTAAAAQRFAERMRSQQG